MAGAGGAVVAALPEGSAMTAAVESVLSVSTRQVE